MELPALSEELRELSAGAASAAGRLKQFDGTMMGLTATAHGLAARLSLLEGKVAALRAEAASADPSAGKGADMAGLADSLSRLIEGLRGAIDQMESARATGASIQTPLAESTRDAAAVGARAARLAGALDPASPALPPVSVGARRGQG